MAAGPDARQMLAVQISAAAGRLFALGLGIGEPRVHTLLDDRQVTVVFDARGLAPVAVDEDGRIPGRERLREALMGTVERVCKRPVDGFLFEHVAEERKVICMFLLRSGLIEQPGTSDGRMGAGRGGL
jgi:hypothetical protein